ncbi:MAG TPA: cobalamin biosynthesis protein [Acidimicrobiales bacterium]|nr:cobalamin biosynthesis protein [Acidimicrobiales bacterium]
MTTDPAADVAAGAPAGGVAVGVGLAGSASAAELAALVARVLGEAGVAPGTGWVVATTDRLAADARVAALGRPVRGWPAAALADVRGVTTASDRARQVIGTASVAEAAALLAAGPGAALTVPRRSSAHATAAVAVGPPVVDGHPGRRGMWA